MPINDELGKRMKHNYESVSQTHLLKRMPVIIRIDGKAFHTFTKGFQKPFDEVLIKTMQETTKYLCENIQGCVFGYTQSDEITLVLVDYQKLESCAWFDYNIQKICSISASMTTLAFNKFFHANVVNARYTEQDMQLLNVYTKAMEKGAMFDSRCFNMPKEEVVNCVYWRQLDAIRNSIQMVGQANFSHKELQYKTCNMINNMLYEQKEINWIDFPIVMKSGTAVIKKDGKWIIDTEMPILKEEGRSYLEKLIHFD